MVNDDISEIKRKQVVQNAIAHHELTNANSPATLNSDRPFPSL